MVSFTWLKRLVVIVLLTEYWGICDSITIGEVVILTLFWASTAPAANSSGPRNYLKELPIAIRRRFRSKGLMESWQHGNRSPNMIH
ncbi:hypothetical protein LY78DRAFT_178588 [Colletotrichum sublineola]|nr:hypothetical protein LY78DRAFT_178588 [Colletotrichum sublineola]